ncbi:Hsp70 family protein [Glycomyces sp. L485]|uniref:Hsp70 family protein n=1 Tax=Glycomyces sp. L485 TaxID=2909235 RepID=UPI001F4B044A|nr:Hsp70 family protein [Glycomyces sp. L485]MCH7229266.1 Hsp70 family protein [Glycomyces sp. L485]
MSRPLLPGPSLGIDFGTSHTIAVVRRPDGSVRPLLFDGAPLMPSAVCVDSSGALLVGRDAVYSGRRYPERFEPNPKRHLDRGSVLLGDREFPITDLVAAVLRAVAEECRRVVGAPRHVTITVPAEWGPARRRIVEDAAARSGLGRVRLVPEPVAAATYFAETLRHHIAVGSSIVVYDLGAGTFDASVVRRTEHGFETVALDGRGDLGGLDIDAAIIDHFARTYGGHDAWRRLTNPSTAEDRRHFRDFQEEIRGAKERLSRHQQADFAIPLLDREAHLTRTELEKIAAPHLEQTVGVTQGVLRAAGLDPARSAGVFLVGGASRMPLVATMLHRALGVAPTVLDQPEVVVGEGSVLWSEPARPALTPQARPAPATPQFPPQRPGPMTPQATSVPQPRSDIKSPPTQATPPQPPPLADAEPVKKKGRAKKVIAAVVVIDVLIVAALIFIFRQNDIGGDEATGLSASLPDAATFEQAGPVIDAHAGKVTSMAIAPTEDGEALFTSGADKTIKKWDLETGDLIEELPLTHFTEILGVTEFSDGRTMVVAMDTLFGFYAWEPETFDREILSEGAGYSDTSDIDRHALGTNAGAATYAVMFPDYSYLWDLEQETRVTGDITLNQDQLNSIRHFAVFDDRISMVTVNAEGELRLFDTETGLDTGLSFETADGWSDSDTAKSLRIVYTDGAPHAMVLSQERYYIWDLASGTFEGSTAWDGDLDANFVHQAVTVDGADALFAFDDDAQGALLNLYSGEQLTVFEDEDDTSNLLTDATATVVDGYTIAVTGFADGTVRLWNLGKG